MDTDYAAALWRLNLGIRLLSIAYSGVLASGVMLMKHSTTGYSKMDCSHDALVVTWVPWRVVTSERDCTTVDRSSKLCLFSDLLGALLCRVRQFLVHEYDVKVLPSTGTEALKAVDAQFNADQFLNERPHVSALIRESLTQCAREFNIVLDDIAVLTANPDSLYCVCLTCCYMDQHAKPRFRLATGRYGDHSDL
ncbi:prohibitin-2-like [Miscanthus floridulus]|uniref:prohibitin-2-like n=1 Tax=Miscanthus floridulus TaxID=154761 RepID=UPI003459A5A4